MGDLTLITGGARSGKSAFAESLALHAAAAAGAESLALHAAAAAGAESLALHAATAAGADHPAARATLPVTYIATLEPLDDEMRDRIARHQMRRPTSWRTVEAGADLAAAARGVPDADVLLLDCIAVWTSNRLLALRDDEPSPAVLAPFEEALTRDVAAFLDVVSARTGPSIVVTNEVGDGVVPPYALGRAYRDALGRVNQQVSRAADRAYLVVVGRPVLLPEPF